MKVVVTGSSGNLGSHILKLNSHEFLGIDRKNWPQLENSKVGEIDAVIHTAYDLKNSIFTKPVENLDSNILSTARLLKICVDKKIKRIGFVSSCAVYGDSSNSIEDKVCLPVTMNGFIKLFNEELIKNFCIQNNIEYQIYRVFNTYGGNDEFSVVHKMINCAKNKTVFNLVNEGVSERDYIHVQDVSKIISNLIEADLKNEIVNIGSGHSVKIIDLLKSVESKFGKIEVAHKSNANESVFSRANIKKLKSLVNFEPIEILKFIEQM